MNTLYCHGCKRIVGSLVPGDVTTCPRCGLSSGAYRDDGKRLWIAGPSGLLVMQAHEFATLAGEDRGPPGRRGEGRYWFADPSKRGSLVEHVASPGKVRA